MKREIVLDTETTGLHPSKGHRLIEIGCVELYDGVPSKETFHCYVNPERDVDPDAEKVHGLSLSFLKDHPVFKDVAENFLKFIQDSTLVIHNAKFDMAFLNAELIRCDRQPLSNPVIDTLQLARSKLPGVSASLDGLCRYFQIDRTHRIFHGALLDARLLSQVYRELTSRKQGVMTFMTTTKQEQETVQPLKKREPRFFPISKDEAKAHAALMDLLKS